MAFPLDQMLQRTVVAAAAVGWLLTSALPASASPFIGAGDSALRSDIQRLADHGVIKGPTSTWPLAWGPILADLGAFDVSADTPPDVLDAIARVNARANWDTRSGDLYFNARASLAEKPKRLRSFEDTPRGRAELSAGATYTGDWFSLALNAQIVDVAGEDEDVRADRSAIAVALGNWSVGVNTLDRWWGPGWDSSVILSNNARPIPAISIDRTFTDAFESKWLAWIGPWDLSAHLGQLESDRVVPDTRFFGMRFAFRPIASLEIGLSRAAQWCGDDRPCNLEAFSDLLIGRDNAGEDDISRANEPGNQLAGFDARWTTRLLGRRLSVYGQLIGEDEAGGFPSRYLGQFGVEASGTFRERWSYRWFAEYAGTSCQFYESSERFNCAYNNGIYQTGYRYRGRSIGHSADNDARLVSVGLLAVDSNENEWAATVRAGELNTGGVADVANSLTPTQQDIVSLDLRHARVFDIGELSVGVGIESIEEESSGATRDDARFFLQWRSSY